MSDLDTRAGRWLLKQRLARGWSKAEMARRMHAVASVSGGKVPGVSSIVRSLGGWELGGRYPRDRWRAVLCQVLGIRLEDVPAAPGSAVLPATAGDLKSDDPRTWVQVALMLVARIDTGKLKPGDSLPRPADVAGQEGVSAPTVRKAYRYLRAIEVAGYWPGAGYYVSGKRPDGPRHDSAVATTMRDIKGGRMPDLSGVSVIDVNIQVLVMAGSACRVVYVRPALV
ncbi:MAG TPA: transcriptional regulator [Streptosporangiaceae bacterium]|nr:transcriptional regulator [Streptosporangiaceae bacterium]